MLQTKDYRIAGLNVRLILPSGWRLIQSPLYRGFRTRFPVPDVIVEFHEIPCFTEESGRMIYEDDQQRVWQKADRIYRYVGNYAYADLFQNISEAGVYCQQYRVNHKGYYITEICAGDREYAEHFLLECAGLTHILADYGRVILHSSFVAYRGEAILFTAPSGTGKSTQAELWRMHCKGAEVINGDRSILAVDSKAVTAYGIPLCGTSGITKNRSMPVRAVIVLRKGEENRIRRLRGREAFALLFSECGINVWSRDDMGRIMQIVSGITETAPVYLYECLPDISAVDALASELGFTYKE